MTEFTLKDGTLSDSETVTVLALSEVLDTVGALIRSLVMLFAVKSSSEQEVAVTVATVNKSLVMVGALMRSLSIDVAVTFDTVSEVALTLGVVSVPHVRPVKLAAVAVSDGVCSDPARICVASSDDAVIDAALIEVAEIWPEVMHSNCAFVAANAVAETEAAVKRGALIFVVATKSLPLSWVQVSEPAWIEPAATLVAEIAAQLSAGVEMLSIAVKIDVEISGTDARAAPIDVHVTVAALSAEHDMLVADTVGAVSAFAVTSTALIEVALTEGAVTLPLNIGADTETLALMLSLKICAQVIAGAVSFDLTVAFVALKVVAVSVSASTIPELRLAALKADSVMLSPVALLNDICVQDTVAQSSAEQTIEPALTEVQDSEVATISGAVTLTPDISPQLSGPTVIAPAVTLVAERVVTLRFVPLKSVDSIDAHAIECVESEVAWTSPASSARVCTSGADTLTPAVSVPAASVVELMDGAVTLLAAKVVQRKSGALISGAKIEVAATRSSVLTIEACTVTASRVEVCSSVPCSTPMVPLCACRAVALTCALVSSGAEILTLNAASAICALATFRFVAVIVAACMLVALIDVAVTVAALQSVQLIWPASRSGTVTEEQLS